MTLPVTIPLPIPFATRVVNPYLLTGDPVTVDDPGGASVVAPDAVVRYTPVRSQ
jgi:hypothetical protein